METYTQTSEASSKLVTEYFSTSFSASTRMLAKEIRQDIYNIYGLVRVADEIVDTFLNPKALELLDELEADVYRTLKTGFSANIIVHAFCKTASQYNIPKSLIKPFFTSMRMDLADRTYTPKLYQTYIYGSAEVVGLMCLMVFVGGDLKEYKRLEKGAAALGTAFQKVNFLRDLKDDFETRGRHYFPVGTYESFNNSVKVKIEKDIAKDLKLARTYIAKLPENARKATLLAYVYYTRLQKKLVKAQAEDLKSKRLRIHNFKKLILFIGVQFGLYGK